MESDEQEPPELDRQKWEKEVGFREREVVVKERDLALREEELALKRKELASSGWHSPLVVAIMVATLAGVGNAAVTFVNSVLQRQLEDLKSEQLRILEMIKTGDPDNAARNLDFLLKAGLISNPEVTSRLRKFLDERKPGSGPALPSPAEAIKHAIFPDPTKQELDVQKVEQMKRCWAEVGVPPDTLTLDFMLQPSFEQARQKVAVCMQLSNK